MHQASLPASVHHQVCFGKRKNDIMVSLVGFFWGETEFNGRRNHRRYLALWPEGTNVGRAHVQCSEAGEHPRVAQTTHRSPSWRTFICRHFVTIWVVTQVWILRRSHKRLCSVDHINDSSIRAWRAPNNYLRSTFRCCLLAL